MNIPLNTLYVDLMVRSARCVTMEKHRLRLSVNRYGIAFTKKISIDSITILCRLHISRGIPTTLITTASGVRDVAFPFSDVMIAPQILKATSASLTVMGQSLIWCDCRIHRKSRSEGYPSEAYNVRAFSARSICH